MTDQEAVIYFGERHTKKLLRSISESVGLPELQWRFDEHEKRLEFDVAEFERLLGSRLCETKDNDSPRIEQ